MTETDRDTNTGSTGQLGLERRSFDRYYLNYHRGVIDDIDRMETLFHLGNEAIERRSMGVTRCVARVLMDQSTLADSMSHPHISQVLEAAVPTWFLTGTSEPIWMVLGAINSPARQSIHSMPEIVASVDSTKRSPRFAPVDRVARLREEGFVFTSEVASPRIGEVLSLWGDSFDWNEDGVTGLQEVLRMQSKIPALERRVWFSGLIDHHSNRLVSIATAERLDMPIGDGRSIPIIESTEWRRHESVNRHGLMAATVSHLHAHVLDDIEPCAPLIIAETNFWSGAHNVGFATGMDVAPRHIGEGFVPQTLVQNVRVRDGLEPVGNRDFTMLYLTPQSQNIYFTPVMRAEILGRSI